MVVTVLLLAIALGTPPWMTVILTVPLADEIMRRLFIPPIATFGSVEIYTIDLVLVVTAIKVLFSFLSNPPPHMEQRLATATPVFVYLATTWIATLWTWQRFGSHVFFAELPPLARLSSQAVAYALLLVSLRESRDLEKAALATYVLGFIAAATVFLDIVLLPFGWAIGEVNEYGTFSRYQGIVGDSAKLFLLPFVFWGLAARHVPTMVFFTAALLATGGRVGLAGLVVGLAVFILQNAAGERFPGVDRGRVAAGLAIVVAFVAAGLWLDIAGMRTRVSPETLLASGLGSLLATWMTAVNVMLAGTNFFFGAGYGGYSLFAPDEATFRVFGSRHDPFLYDTFSQLLRAGVDGGIVGLAVFVWMTVRIVRVLNTASRDSKALRPMLQAAALWTLTLLILSPFATWLLPRSPVSDLLWIFFAIGTVALTNPATAHEPFALPQAVPALSYRRFL